MERVTLNRKEQNRLMILNEVNVGTLSINQAGVLMEISLRHTKRLLAGYRKEGAGALAHGNRGRKPANMIDTTIRKQVVELAGSRYRGFNQQHFTEKLAECEQTHLSRSSVRRILLENGICSPRKRSAPRHRSRRERYPQEGMLLQTDGSPHDWLEGRGPRLCLIGAIDDATNEVPYAHFRDQEDSVGYMQMLQGITLSRGIPLALYHDRHSIFEVNIDSLPSLEEQLAGTRPLTQVGRLLAELGINSISANSPQAKGRVERLWQTFQDRLVSELRLAGASTKAEASQVLDQFLPEHNRKFMIKARETGSSYRQPQHGFKPEEFFCFKYPRIVGIDNVVRFGQQRLQILPTPERQSYARCRVEVQVRLDGGIAIYHEGKPLNIQPAPLEASALRKHQATPLVISKLSQPVKPATSHPWRQWVYR
jgi:transposase